METVRIENGSPCPVAERRVVVLGFFDGMHIGHAALFRRAREEAGRRSCELAVFSFLDDGGLKPGLTRLSGEEERLARMAEEGAERVFLYRFSDVRDLSPAAFVEDILLGTLSAAACVCGYNFRFGAGGVGDASLLSSLLAERGVPLLVIPEERLEGQPVSTSAIRAALSAGDAALAARMLGRPYAIRGTVAHGRALGRTIGVPTANLPIPPGRAMPAYGVYAALGQIEGDPRLIPGIANIGVRPTVEDGGAPNCETHFLTPVGDLYGREVTVSLLHRLRGERQFENLAALHTQILQDAAEAKEYIAQWQNGRN